MPFDGTELDDFDEVAAELAPYLETLPITDAPVQELEFVAFEAFRPPQFGTASEVLPLLVESLKNIYTIGVPEGYEVQIGLIDEHAPLGYIEVMYRLQLIGAGSLNIPHAIIRRSETLYEVLLPRPE